jgi:DNA-binding response OmpR family regulator
MVCNSLAKGEKLRPRILIFEDNDTLRSTLKFILNKRGYEVFAFSNPKMCQAFDSDNRNYPADHACADVIISDVNMPTKTGLDLIKERQQQGCKVRYRALMSADWTDSDLKHAHELGCYIFHKPFNLKKMIKWLDDCSDNINPERKLSDLVSKMD